MTRLQQIIFAQKNIPVRRRHSRHQRTDKVGGFGGRAVKLGQLAQRLGQTVVQCHRLAAAQRVVAVNGAVARRNGQPGAQRCIPFYTFAALSQFFFCGFNTAIYAIVPDCVEYGEWKTGVRNDGFQYAFVSLGNKLGMAIGTSALAGVLSALSFAPNQVQNAAVQNAMHYAFSLLPGVLWLITAIVLFFYRISKRSYNQIMSELNAKKTG